MPRRGGWIGVAALGLVVLGCASKQRIALDCVPSEVTVYVDGRALSAQEKHVELRPDRAHTLYFKGGAYEPQMVVLETGEVEGEVRLSPADVCSQTRFVEMQPEIQMEIDSDVSGGPPGL